ncbi:phage tail tape measure protein [Paenibacillus donghaensis]|uniref:Phage tail tape measure protein n=1 Tax=Paenibacillus donghaensis TaxID=414771 RepID=A0A2Z2K903_9BACL|nr:phage tail tape measure protein [Paenibacillus donghaensis]ASA21817.1 phage tail tape measure protein [Paenibacillus donghaensis]
MSQNLKILISASLDTKKSIREVNSQISKILQPQIKDIKANVKVNIDSKALNGLKSVVDGFGKVREALKENNRVISQHEKIVTNETGVINKWTQQQLKSGEVITKTQEIINKKTQGIKNHTAAIRIDQSVLDGYGKKLKATIQLNSELRRVASSEVYGTKNFNTTVNKNSDGNVTGGKRTENYDREAKDLALQNKKKEALAHQLKLYQQVAQIKFDNLKNMSMPTTSRTALEKWLSDVKALTTATPKLSQELKQMDVNLRRISSEAKNSSSGMNTFGNTISKTLGKITMWVGGMSLFYAPFRGLKEAVSLIYKVDEQMTQLKRVMDSFTDFEGMLARQSDLAKKLGRSMTDVGESMIEFARMGNNESQTMDLTKVAVLAQNISELTPTEAVNAITSAMISFNIEADRSITIVDKLNQIDNNYSVTTQQLAIGMQKAGATAKQFGVEMDTLLGYETAIMSATRESGSVVGNSLRTIFSRITTMDKAEDTLKSVGVSIRGLSGDVKPVQDILTDLQSKWSTLSNEQQQNIGVTLAGRNQLNKFLALLSNWNTGLEATEEALHSQGSAVSENAKYMQSLESRTNIMKASWQELALTMGSAVITDSLVGLIKVGTGFANAFTWIVDKVGLLPVVLGSVGFAAYGMSAAFKAASTSIVISVINASRAIAGLPAITTLASAGIKGLTISIAGLKAGLRGLLAASGVGLVLTAIGFAAEWAINKFSGAKEEIQDTTEALTTLSDQIAIADRLKELSTEYETLAKKVILTAEEKIKLSRIESELQSKYELSLTSLGAEGEGYKENQGLIETKINLLEEEIRLKRESASLEFRSEESSVRSDIEKQKKDMETAVKAAKEVQDKYQEFLNNRDSKKAMSNQEGYWSDMFSPQQSLDPNKSGDVLALNKLGEYLADALKEANKKMSSATDEYKKNINKASEGIKGEFRNFVDGMEKSGEKIEPATRAIFDALAQLDAENGLKLDTKQLQEFFTLLNTPNVKSIDDVNKVFEKKLPKSISGVGEQLKTLRDVFMKIQFGTAGDEMSDGLGNMGDESEDTEKKVLSLSEALTNLNNEFNAQNVEEFAKSIEATKDEIKTLNTAQSEMQENGHLSIDTISKMNSRYDDFKGYVNSSKESLLDFIAAKKEEAKAIPKAENEITQDLLTNTGLRLQAMKDQYQANLKLLELKVSNGDLNAEKILIREYQAIQEVTKWLEEASAKYGITKAAAADLNEVANESKKENDKLTDSYTDTVEILTELQKKLEVVKKAQEDLISSRSRMSEGEQKYRDSLKEENRLIQEQIKLNKQGIEHPERLVSTKVITTVKTSSGDETTSTPTPSSSSGTGSTSTNTQYSELINKYAGIHDLDPNLIAAIIKTESSFNTNSTSSAGAAGLMQLMPGTAKGLGVKNSYDPEQNIAGGTKHFARLVKKYNGDIELALYAYNAGEGNVDKWIKNGKINNIPFKETKAYAPKVLKAYGGFSGKSIESNIPKLSTTPSTTGVSTSKVGGTTTKTDAPTDKDMADAVEEKVTENKALLDKKYENDLKILASIKYKYERLVAAAQLQIEASKKVQETLDPDSLEWRQENVKQVNIDTQIQTLKKQERSNLQSTMKELKVNSDEYNDIRRQLETDVSDIQTEKNQKFIENFDSEINASKQRISDLDNLIEQSKNRMSNSIEGSPEYNKELNTQIELTKKQKTESESLKKTLDRLINSQNVDAVSKKNFKTILDELNLTDYTSGIKELNASLIESKATPLTDTLDDLNYQYDLSEAKIKGLKEGTKEYNEETKNQIRIINDQVKATKNLIAYYETQSKNQELSATDREGYSKQVKELTLSMNKYSDSLKSLREDYADKVIEKYKKMLQEQQKLQNAAYDKEKETEDARHEARMDNLDEEMSAFEAVINAQSKSLDREVAGEDYTEQLTKLQKEKAELDAKFSSKLLDDSLEAKAQRADLQKEIDSKAEEITKLQRDREITIRKDGLSDQLEDRKNAVDKEKKLEDDKNKLVLKGIEEAKKKNDEYYDGLLNDEQYFFDMKQNLMSDDTVKIQNELSIVQAAYDAFFKELEAKSGTYGAKIAENLKYSIKLDKDYAKNLPTSDGSGNSSGLPGVEEPKNTTPVESKNQRDSSWNEYLSNKQKAEQLLTEMRTLIKDSSDYKNKQAEVKRLNTINEAYRKQYGFQDGSYDYLYNLTKYHSGGEVGVEGTSTKGWWNSLKDFEVPAILKKGEVVIDRPQDFFGMIANNVLSNLKNNLSQVSSVMSNKKSDAAPVVNHYKFDLNIDNITGDKKGAKIVTDSIEELWNKKTKQGW